MKSILFVLIVLISWSTSSFAAKYSYTERPLVYKALRISRSLLNAIVAYHATYGFSPVKTVTVSTITVERDGGHAEDSHKVHTCKHTFNAELENGGKLSAVEEFDGACR